MKSWEGPCRGDEGRSVRPSVPAKTAEALPVRDEHRLLPHQLTCQVYVPLIGEDEGDERLGGIRRAPLVKLCPGDIGIDRVLVDLIHSIRRRG
jgi:hypothetical protein